MPEFLPFIGTRYNPSTVRADNVTSPPYDVISSEFRDVLYERDPHNVIRLEFNRDADPYTSAARNFEAWKNEKILIREERPAYYVYHQIFDKPEGGQITRTGVLGRLSLAPDSVKQVLPHERTHAGPIRDRFELMAHTHANFSPIFGLVSDPTLFFDQTLEIATAYAPLMDVDEHLENGQTVRHILWRLDDTLAADRIQKIVAPSKIIIADGHHRFKTARQFYEQHQDIAGAGYIMMFISNLESEGAVILPTHRLLEGLAGFDQYQLLERLKEKFELTPFSSREEGVAVLERDESTVTLIEFPDDPKWVLVSDLEPTSKREKELTATRLEEEILIPMVGLSRTTIDERRNLLYPHTFRELDELEESQNWNAAFLLRSVRPSELKAVVNRGEYMPQKTTYFYPKLLTGLVFHEFEIQPKP